MSLHLAVVTLLAVGYVNLASTEESMGLCYRCPLQKFENNEGSVFAWVKSFLQEMRRKCPGLYTRRNTTPRTTTSPRTEPKKTSTNPPTTTTNPQTSTIDPPTTTTDLTTVTEPPTTTTVTEPPTTTTVTVSEPPTMTTVSEPPTTTTVTEPPTTTTFTEPPTTTTVIEPPTTTTVTEPPITTTVTELPTTTTVTESPTTTTFTEPPTTTTVIEPPTATTVSEPPTATRVSKLPTTTTDQSAATTDHPNTPIAATTSPLNTPTQTGALPTTTTEPPTTTTTAGPADCQPLLDAGHTESGVYNINPAQYPDGLEVYCDMTTDSKGWIVFQRRVDGSVSFIRSWAEYRDGFGDKEGEFWLGNEILRRLTEPVDGEQGWQMRVELLGVRQHDGMYDDFHVDGNNYTLHVGAFTSPTWSLGDELSVEYPSNGQPFSTYDRDNDADTSRNCADEMKGGWWFNQCTAIDDFEGAARHSNLNGEYSQIPNWNVYGRGIVWTNVRGRINRSEMKMRRKI